MGRIIRNLLFLISKLNNFINLKIRYFNHKFIAGADYPVGIGFGGENYKNFRLWIDEEIETNSYIETEDSTYEIGSLAAHHIKKLNVIFS